MFLSTNLVGLPEQKRPPKWLNSDFIDRHRAAVSGYEKRLKFWGALPSFQDNIATLNSLRRQLGCEYPSTEPLYEPRYPFLDRGLLEFLFAIPRDQLVRPGHRRSLMRRSLFGIVPDAVLNRRRKAYVARAPLASFSKQSAALDQLSTDMISALFGIVDLRAFADVIERAEGGQMVCTVNLIRTLHLESWLRALVRQRVVDPPPRMAAGQDCRAHHASPVIQHFS